MSSPLTQVFRAARVLLAHDAEVAMAQMTRDGQPQDAELENGRSAAETDQPVRRGRTDEDDDTVMDDGDKDDDDFIDDEDDDTETEPGGAEGAAS